MPTIPLNMNAMKRGSSLWIHCRGKKEKKKKSSAEIIDKEK